MKNIDDVVKARLAQAVAEHPSRKAEHAIWAAVLMAAGMGAVPFGINLGWFLAVTTGLIVYLGELHGYTYTKEQARDLLKQIVKASGSAQNAYFFGLKFIAEALKSAGPITMGGATPVGMALDAALSGGITYAVGYTTLRHLQQNQQPSAAEIRSEFRSRFQEGRARVQALARQRGDEMVNQARTQYAAAASDLKHRADRAKHLALASLGLV